VTIVARCCFAAPVRSHRVRRSQRRISCSCPPLVIYAVFTVYPIYRPFEHQFFNWHIFPGVSDPFVGWSNYTAIFTIQVIRTAAWNSFLFIVITVPIQMAIGVFRRRRPNRSHARINVPGERQSISSVTSWVVVSWVFSYIFASRAAS